MPASLARSRINVLSLAGNTLTELPAWFSTHFPHVRQMDLSHNPLGDGAFSQLGRKFGNYRLKRLNVQSEYVFYILLQDEPVAFSVI